MPERKQISKRTSSFSSRARKVQPSACHDPRVGKAFNRACAAMKPAIELNRVGAFWAYFSSKHCSLPSMWQMDTLGFGRHRGLEPFHVRHQAHKRPDHGGANFRPLRLVNLDIASRGEGCSCLNC
jgi:hypothetical protein